MVNTVIFATRDKNIVSTVVLSFRGAKYIGIYGIFFPTIAQVRQNTAYLMIFRGPQKCDNTPYYKNKNNSSRKIRKKNEKDGRKGREGRTSKTKKKNEKEEKEEE